MCSDNPQNYRRFVSGKHNWNSFGRGEKGSKRGCRQSPTFLIGNSALSPGYSPWPRSRVSTELIHSKRSIAKITRSTFLPSGPPSSISSSKDPQQPISLGPLPPNPNMSETSAGDHEQYIAIKQFSIRYKTAVSASLASLASTTVGYSPSNASLI
jgi:hypothetical protein